jgi:hypothetical protein
MGNSTVWARDEIFRSEPMEVFEKRMHQILLAAAKLSDGMPCRVTMREV